MYIDKRKFFFSPQPMAHTVNNYIVNFYETLARSAHLVNFNKKHVSRSIDFLRYAFRCDVMVLNWPEDVLHLRFGILQVFITVISLTLFKIKGGKIIWICHNKDSHTKRHRSLRKFLRGFFTLYSNAIVVHSQDAVDYFSGQKHKLHFLPHPIYHQIAEKPVVQEKPLIDVLIWGNITPYKGLHAFIENYKKQGATFKVTIIGKADKGYLRDIINTAQGSAITITDAFLSEDELYKKFSASKIILLPYLDSDTFSSGALIHSLNSRKIVLGPNVGNFIDLYKCGACLTYTDYPGLFATITHLLKNPQQYDETVVKLNKGIDEYYRTNTWENFIKNILSLS